MVEVFKTNVQQPEVAVQLTSYIRASVTVERVNFDLHDCDNILRVEGEEFTAGQIIAAVTANGYKAELL